MDNLPAHKVAGVQEAIQAAQASLLYLPAYSPDLNPIEQVFRQAQGAPQEGCGSDQGCALGHHRHLLDAFTPEECANYLANCGYEPV
jgi:hypothetical protein